MTSHLLRQRNQSGSSIIEAAIALPVVMLLCFAGIDAGLYMKNHLTVGSAARSAARAGATGGAEAHADFYVLSAVAKNSAGFGVSSIERIVVYKAANYDAAPTVACSNGIATVGVCNVYTPADLSRPVTDFGGGNPAFGKDLFWPGPSRQVTRGSGVDLLGVQVQARTSTPSGVLGQTTYFLKRQTVIQLEARRG